MRAGLVGACVAGLGWALLSAGAAGAGVFGATEAYPPFGLAEGSGLAASGLHAGVVWVVEDNGEPPDDLPVVRAFDQSSTEVGSVTLTGWTNQDIEALAIGPGPTLWVADIGDPDATRENVVVHTFDEPVDLAAATLEPVSYGLRYPDGPVDAEALMVDPVDGRVYVASKRSEDDGGLFIAPEALVAGETHDLALVTSVPSWITDGAFTPDGERLVLLQAIRNQSVDVLIYDVTRPGGGAPVTIAQTSQIPVLGQLRSELVAVTPDGTMVLVGAGGKDEPVLSVPLSAASAATEAPTETPDRPGAVDEPGSAAAQGSGDCVLSDPVACLDEPTGWLAIAAVLIAVLLITALVVLRRSRRRPGQAA